ncbi:hypothetical protein LF934_03080 [Dickeya dadantii]|uniref:hypothetical protein n=1 Tax=Dickeya dadantii TaxID=204038 RepID=UPI001CF17DC6|nr:hypothetical protein [Dickeya dadantii]MCA7011616.1 hypothetical protein [Dickeya dadantii]
MIIITGSRDRPGYRAIKPLPEQGVMAIHIVVAVHKLLLQKTKFYCRTPRG